MPWDIERFRAASAPTSTSEWLTPKGIIDALGPFDLDPCSPVNRPWPTASVHYTIEDDGLSKPWSGFVWMNPPYERGSLPRWMARFAEHNHGIALVNARTETSWFVKSVWPKALALFFPAGRIVFCRPDGSEADAAGSPSVFIAMGSVARERLAHINLPGQHIAGPFSQDPVKLPTQSAPEVISSPASLTA